MGFRQIKESVMALKMKLYKHILMAIISSFPVYADESKFDEVVIGVFADRGIEEAQTRWQPMINWLNQQIPEYRFQLLALELGMLQTEVSSQRLQFMIINPSESIRLGRIFPLSWMATLISPLAGGTTTATGSALWVRENSPYHTTENLAGKRIGTVDRRAFGGFMAMENEALRPEYPGNFLSQVQELGYPHENIVRALLDNNIEAAILPVCLVESLIARQKLEAGKLRLINSKTPTGFECQVSTELYPNWSFAMLGNADRQLAKKIVQSLLNLPTDSPEAKAAQSLGWSVPESQVELDRLFENLGIHPLQLSMWQQLLRWIVQYYYVAILIVIIFTVLPIQYVILQFRFHRNSLKLRKMQDDFQQIQRRALVDKLGASLAHELNQPLSAIRLYADGEISRQKKGDSQTNIVELLTKIRNQVVRVDEVVKRLRQLLKKEPASKTRFDLSNLLQETCALVSLYAQRYNITIKQGYISNPVLFYGDRIGLEQLLVNLLTNAIDSTAEAGNSLIFIELLQTKLDVSLCVYDQGVGLNAPLSTLMTPFVTSKANGVGLGLTVCQEVVESHLGKFTLRNRAHGGVEAKVCLPRKVGNNYAG